MASSRYISSVATLVLLVCAVFLQSPAYGDSSAITFELEKKVEFGQGFVITGSDPALGNWDPEKAAFMNVTGDSSWSVTVDLPIGVYVEYKPVRIVYDTRQVLEWFPGSNLHITVNVINVVWPDSAKSNVADE